MKAIAHSRMVDGGRIIVPAEFRRAMGVAPGDALVLSLDGAELRVRSRMAVLQDIQDEIEQLVPDGRSLADELIAERRAAADKA